MEVAINHFFTDMAITNVHQVVHQTTKIILHNYFPLGYSKNQKVFACKGRDFSVLCMRFIKAECYYCRINVYVMDYLSSQNQMDSPPSPDSHRENLPTIAASVCVHLDVPPYEYMPPRRHYVPDGSSAALPHP